jgi:peptidoglycan/LPS O-acetylase OafA/YrhL
MIHNFDAHAVYSLCGIFWTLALEEQLYLLYFVLLGLRRRLGWKWTLALCLGARVATAVGHMLLKRWTGIEVPFKEMATSQWFIWALGAVAVEAHLGLVELPRWCRDRRVGLTLLALGMAGIAFTRHHPSSSLCKPIWFVIDPVLGLGFFVIMNRFVASEAAWRLRGGAPKLVRRLAQVGIFSYSLYLTHEIIITYASVTVARWLGIANTSLLDLALVPACLALAWVFFQLLERPFLHGPAGWPTPRPIAAAAAPQRVPVSPV